jgi:hypothetical protein
MYTLRQTNNKESNQTLSQLYYGLKNGKKRRVIMAFSLEFSCKKRTFYNKINGITKIRKAEQNFLNKLINE